MPRSKHLRSLSIDVPPEIVDKVKCQAIAENRKIKAVILAALNDYFAPWGSAAKNKRPKRKPSTRVKKSKPKTTKTEGTSDGTV